LEILDVAVSDRSSAHAFLHALALHLNVINEDESLADGEQAPANPNVQAQIKEIKSLSEAPQQIRAASPSRRLLSAACSPRPKFEP